MQVLILLAIVLLPINIYAADDTFNPRDTDKQLHMLAAYSIDTTLLAALPKDVPYRRLKAAGLTAAVGLAKELHDPVFSTGDLKADAVGIITSNIFSYTFEF